MFHRFRGFRVYQDLTARARNRVGLAHAQSGLGTRGAPGSDGTPGMRKLSNTKKMPSGARERVPRGNRPAVENIKKTPSTPARLAVTAHRHRCTFVNPSMAPSLGARLPFVRSWEKTPLTSSTLAADLLLLRRYGNKDGVMVVVAAKKKRIG